VRLLLLSLRSTPTAVSRGTEHQQWQKFVLTGQQSKKLNRGVLIMNDGFFREVIILVYYCVVGNLR
jgi:hypothetical protein